MIWERLSKRAGELLRELPRDGRQDLPGQERTPCGRM